LQIPDFQMPTTIQTIPPIRLQMYRMRQRRQ